MAAMRTQEEFAAALAATSSATAHSTINDDPRATNPM